MDDLRLVLLLLGVVLVALLYLLGRRRSRKPEWELPEDADLSGERVLPETIKPEDEWEIVPLRAARESRLEDGALEEMRGFSPQSSTLDEIPTLTDVVGSAKPPKPMPQIVFALTVVAKQGHAIGGKALAAAAHRAGLSFGSQSIFHHLDQGNVVFSMANILEPGTFDVNNLENFSTPGVALFMQLPGTIAGTLAVRRMIESARILSQQLDARLCDERRAPLTEQGIARLLDKARSYAPAPAKSNQPS